MSPTTARRARRFFVAALGATALAPAASAAQQPPAPSASAAGWRSERPPVPPAEAPVLPEFQRARLENGLVLMATRVPGVPVVSFELVTRGGAALDPKGKAGLSGLTYDLLSEGTESLDALAFSDRVADFGARFGSSAGREAGSVTIVGLARHGDALVDLLAQAVQTPRLATADFQRVRAERLANLQRQLASPQGIAFQEFPEMIYGPEHPFGHPPSGSLESIRKITLDDVKAQAQRLLVPGASALVAAGDIDLATLEKLAKAHFGTWTGPNPGDRSVPAVEPRARRSLVVLDKPGLPQALLLFGRPVFGRGHPDELPVELLNQVVGGTFSSRLNMNLREDKGYTYGASTRVSLRNGVGVLLGYASVQNPHAAASLKEALGELERLDAEPPTPEELSRAKDGIVRSLTGRFETSGSVASAAASLFLYELPLDHLSTLGPRYREVERQRVLDARRYFDPAQMQVLWVGDASVIVPQLEAAGFDPVEIRQIPTGP